MNIGVVSLGCVKNRVDTEQMLSVLTQAGHTFTPDPAEADIIIVNTCGFIDPAKEESIQTILEMAGYKQNGRCKKLIVTGCLAQRYGDALLQDMPEIDALLGVSQYDRITEAVENVMAGQRPDYRQRRWDMLECGRVLTTPGYSAYVRIGEGCDNRCAYCAMGRLPQPGRAGHLGRGGSFGRERGQGTDPHQPGHHPLWPGQRQKPGKPDGQGRRHPRRGMAAGPVYVSR